MQAHDVAVVLVRLVSLIASALIAARLIRVLAQRHGLLGVVPPSLWGYAGQTSAWGGALVGVGTGRVIFLLISLGEWWSIIFIIAIGALGALAAAYLAGFTAILWLPRRLLASDTPDSERTWSPILVKFGTSIGVRAAVLGMIIGFVLTYCVWTLL